MMFKHENLNNVKESKQCELCGKEMDECKEDWFCIHCKFGHEKKEIEEINPFK